MLLGHPKQGASGTAWQEEVSRAGPGQSWGWRWGCFLTQLQVAPAPAGSVLGGERLWLPSDVSLLRTDDGCSWALGVPSSHSALPPFPHSPAWASRSRRTCLPAGRLRCMPQSPKALRQKGLGHSAEGELGPEEGGSTPLATHEPAPELGLGGMGQGFCSHLGTDWGRGDA